LQGEIEMKLLRLSDGQVVEVVKTDTEQIKPRTKTDILQRVKYSILAFFLSFFCSIFGNEAYAKNVLAQFPYGWDKDIPHRVDMGTASSLTEGLYWTREYDARIGCANCGKPTNGKKFCSVSCKREWDQKGMRRDPMLAVFPDEDKDDVYEDWGDWISDKP
jgi:hypothetical protein